MTIPWLEGLSETSTEASIGPRQAEFRFERLNSVLQVVSLRIFSQVAVKALRFLPSTDDIRVSGIYSSPFTLKAELLVHVAENP